MSEQTPTPEPMAVSRKRNLGDALALLGVALAAVGLGLIYLPLLLITAGVAMVALGLLIARPWEAKP